MEDGGVMLFVVYIDDTGKKTQIYYAKLLPIKIRLLLSDSKEPKTKSFKLRKFPEDNNKKTSILLDFYKNMKLQTSFANAELLSEEELRKREVLENITFSITKYGSNITIDDLFTQDEIYVYAKIKGINALQPLLEIPENIHIAEKVDVNVTVNDVKFYGSIQRIRSKEKTELYVGKSVCITFYHKGQNMHVKFKPTDVLKDALVDIPFILALRDYEKVGFNGTVLALDGIKQTYSLEKIRILKNNLSYFQRVAELFETLRLDMNCDLSKMNVEDKINTRRLFDAILEGKEVSGLKENIPIVVTINYIHTKIALVFSPKDKPGTYIITDYFNDNTFQLFHEIDGEKIPTSKFSIMHAENFLELGNVNYDTIIESFVQHIEEPLCLETANQILLEMLLAYDKSQDKKSDILDYALKLSEWILENTVSETELYIRKLNYFQVIKRKYPLTDIQTQELLELTENISIEDKNQELQLKIGINLLLDNQSMAEFYYKKLSKDIQKWFQEFPIFRFWKDKSKLKE